MSIKMMRSTDRGAPVMTGQQGKMCDLLLKCLVEGYPTVAQGVNGANASSGDHTTVTLHVPGHPFSTGQEVTISGLDDEFNGRVTLTATSADYIFYTKTGTSSYPTGGSAVVGGEALVGTAASVTRSGTTVTVVLTGHGFAAGQRAKLGGAAQPEYNGWKTITTVADANTFTFELPATQTPVTPATGTIKAYYGSCGVGWHALFSATNRRVFQQGRKGSQARHVLVADETNVAYFTKAAMLGMAEAATSASVLTGQYYSSMDANRYLGTVKSATNDTTARKWVIVGDHRTFMLFTQPGYSDAAVKADGWCPNYFGDFISFVPGDTAPILSAPTLYGGYSLESFNYSLGGNMSDGGTYIANVHNYGSAFSNSEGNNHPLRIRTTHLGAAGYIQPTFASVSDSVYVTSYNGGFTRRNASAYTSPSYYNIGYPDPVHGGFNIEVLHLMHPAAADNSGSPVLRGRARGLHHFLHNRGSLPVSNNDTFDGAGDYAGKTFEIFDFTYTTGGVFGAFVVEISDTWES